MALYHYQSGSLLDSVQLRTNEAGGMRAYLVAANDAPSDVLRAKKQDIRALGWKCVPIVHDGKPALEVRGFKDANELTVELHRLGITGTAASITPDEGDKRRRKDKWGNSTLKTAGALYIAGDLMFFYSKGGPLVKKWKNASTTKSDRFFGIVDLVAGVGYMLGSLTLAIFGSRDQSLNTIESATKKIERYARKEGYSIVPESSIAFANEDPNLSIGKKIGRFLDKYPSEMFNSIYILVGSALSSAALYRGLKPIEKNLAADAAKAALDHRRTELLDVGLGAVTATSGLIGVAVNETKPLPGDEKRHGIGRIVDWIKEKPLRASGYGYLVATGVHAFTTLRHWKGSHEENKFLIGRVGFIALNVVAELLLAVSSKGHGAGVKPDDSVDKSVIGATAELILRQPIEKREAIIQNMAGYMASRDVLGVKAEKIAAELRTHIDLLDNNPWTKHYVPNQNGEMQEVEAHATAKQIEQAHAAHADTPSSTIHQAEYVAKHQAPLAPSLSA